MLKDSAFPAPSWEWGCLFFRSSHIPWLFGKRDIFILPPPYHYIQTRTLYSVIKCSTLCCGHCWDLSFSWSLTPHSPDLNLTPFSKSCQGYRGPPPPLHFTSHSCDYILNVIITQNCFNSDYLDSNIPPKTITSPFPIFSFRENKNKKKQLLFDFI